MLGKPLIITFVADFLSVFTQCIFLWKLFLPKKSNPLECLDLNPDFDVEDHGREDVDDDLNFELEEEVLEEDDPDEVDDVPKNDEEEDGREEVDEFDEVDDGFEEVDEPDEDGLEEDGLDEDLDEDDDEFFLK